MPYGLIGAFVRLVVHSFIRLSFILLAMCVISCCVVLNSIPPYKHHTHTHTHTHTLTHSYTHTHTHTHTVNGSLVELLDDVKYLLSPQDLMAIDYVPELVVAGTVYYSVV